MYQTVEPFQCRAEIIRWIDGDTVDVIAYSVFNPWPDITDTSVRKMRLRLAIVDTPERGQPGFKEATLNANAWVPAGSRANIILYSMERSGPRWVADVLVEGLTDTVSSLLLRDGLGKVWS